MRTSNFMRGFLVVASLTAGLCNAACLSDGQARDLAERFFAKKPVTNPEGLSEADGDCSGGKFNALLARHYGKVVGYKAGLTNPALRRKFNVFKPVWGKLYEGMVLPDGAVVEAAFGARPLFEADLLLRVGSESINEAKTLMDVLTATDQIIPFIELPDLMVEKPAALTGPVISAINVGARLGVAGKPIDVPRMRAERFELLDALRDMSIVVSDGAGAELGRGRGSDISGHPLNAALFLVGALAKEGLSLKPGDLLSLGSFVSAQGRDQGQRGVPGAAGRDTGLGLFQVKP